MTNPFREHPNDPPAEAQALSWRALVGAALSIVILVASGAALLFLVFCAGPFAWLLRDGLGPDSTTSVGWSAVTRMFWCFYWGPATLLTLVTFVAALFLRRSGSSSTAPSGAPSC